MARVLISKLIILSQVVFARDLNELYEKVTLNVGKTPIQAYVADNEVRREQGLMFVENLPDNVGMLFIFDSERPLSFWMKNTLIPLSIGFFDQDGKLVDVQEMKVAKSLTSTEVPSYYSQAPARFALEMNAGWFARHKIKPTQEVRLSLKSQARSQLLNGALKKTRQ